MRTILVICALAACSSGPPAAVSASGTSWPEADALFHQDPRWLGADAAYSIDLGGGRVAWLFGDTFVATTSADLRAESKMVRNTVGVETGLDPASATMQFAWASDATGTPGSFFAEDGDRWHWPGGGVRLPSGTLVVFLWIMRADSGGLGFASDGWRAVSIANADLPPAQWTLARIDPPAQAFDAVPIAAALDGDFVDLLAIDGAHHGMLARIPATGALDLAAIRWWDGGAWSAGPPAIVIDDAGAEASLSYDAARGVWLHVASYGFGATTIGVRTAPAVTGPWSAATDAFTPPEDARADPFVYAGKAHPELVAGGSLAVTYATNSFTFADLFTTDGQRDLYWPRFATLALSPAPR